MDKDLFTFSIQEAETLGIECAIVLAASKDLKITSSTNGEIVVLLKEKIPFLEEQEILDHLGISEETQNRMIKEGKVILSG